MMHELYRRGVPARRAGLAVCLLSVLLLSQSHAQDQPFFWRGAYLFSLEPASNKARFFDALANSLRMNIYQVRTFRGASQRNEFFLRNDANLKVIVQENAVIARVAGVEESSPHFRNLRGRDQSGELRSEIRLLASYPAVYRFYLRDEPTPGMMKSWRYVRDFLRDSTGIHPTKRGAVAAFADTGRTIRDFLAVGRPSELIVDPYYIFNSIPHPSLEGHPDIAHDAGIRAWEDYLEKDRDGNYLGLLQMYVNQALRERIRVAADAVARATTPTSLILVPQLHGVLDSLTGVYDLDDDPDRRPYLRPPSPSELRLQYYLGMAYGVKGFLAYPYGTDIVHADPAVPGSRTEAYVGLVPPHRANPSLLQPTGNSEVLFGRRVYTGYREKWDELAKLNRRFEQGLGDTLLPLKWIGAKAWTMSRSWEPMTEQTSGWNSDLVTEVKVSTAGKIHDELPQVEIGNLRRGSTDYLAVVNRRCSARDDASITITLARGRVWRVVDVEDRSRTWRVQGGNTFTDTFEPGGGHLYRLDRAN
jgi:hypothetical protein